jgi:hypothetical protein
MAVARAGEDRQAGRGHAETPDQDKAPAKQDKAPAQQNDGAANGGKQQRTVSPPAQGIGRGPAVVNHLGSHDATTGANKRIPSNLGKPSNQTPTKRIDVAGHAPAESVQPAPTQTAAVSGASSQPDDLVLKRKALIDSWIRQHDPDNRETTQTARASDVVDFLKGGLFQGQGGEEGKLRPEEQRYFLGRVLPMMDQRQVEDLALAVKDDNSVNSIRNVVAEKLRDTALDFARKGHSQIQARAFALNLSRATQNDLPGLGKLIVGLPTPKDAAVIPLLLGNQKLTDHTQAVKSDPRLNDPRTLAQARDLLCVAMSTVDVTEGNKETINTVTLAFREKASPSDLQNAPASSHHLALLMARQYAWARSVNGDLINPVLLAARFERVLDTQNGAVFLLLGQSDTKSAAWDAVAHDESIDRTTFEQYSDPSKSPAIARGMAISKINSTRDGKGNLIAKPDDKETVDRVAGIIQSPGYEVMFGPASFRNRDLATQIILTRRDVTAASFNESKQAAYYYERNDPWYALRTPIAEMYNVADAPSRPVGAIAIKNILCILKHEKPTAPKGVTISDADIAAAAQAARTGGPFPAVFTNNDFFPDSDVGKFTDQLLAHAQPKDPPQFTVKTITCIGRQAGGIATDLVVGIQSGVDANGKPKFTYTDTRKIYSDTTKDTGRSSSDLKDSSVSISAYDNWHDTNDLPGGIAIHHGPDGKLVVEETPEARNTAHQVARTSAKVGIGVAIVAGAIGTDGAALLAFGAGTWGMTETAYEEARAISDMAAHQQSLRSPEGVAHVIGFAASVTGVAPGVTRVGMAVAGFEEAAIESMAWTLSRVSVGVHGISVGYHTWTAATSPTPLTLAQKLELLTGFAMFSHSALSLGPRPQIEPTLPRARALDAAELPGKRLAPAPAKPPAAEPAQPAAAAPPRPPAAEPATKPKAAEPARPRSEPEVAAQPVTPSTGRVVWVGRTATLIDRMHAFLGRLGFGPLAGEIEKKLVRWMDVRNAQQKPPTEREIADKIAELAGAPENGLSPVNLRGLKNNLNDVFNRPSQTRPYGVNFNNGPRNEETANPQQQQAVVNGGPGPSTGPNVGPNTGPTVVPTNLTPGQTSAVGPGGNRPGGHPGPTNLHVIRPDGGSSPTTSPTPRPGPSNAPPAPTPRPAAHPSNPRLGTVPPDPEGARVDIPAFPGGAGHVDPPAPPPRPSPNPHARPVSRPGPQRDPDGARVDIPAFPGGAGPVDPAAPPPRPSPPPASSRPNPHARPGSHRPPAADPQRLRPPVTAEPDETTTITRPPVGQSNASRAIDTNAFMGAFKDKLPPTVNTRRFFIVLRAKLPTTPTMKVGDFARAAEDSAKEVFEDSSTTSAVAQSMRALASGQRTSTMFTVAAGGGPDDLIQVDQIQLALRAFSM